jgi:hypothetical protein
MIGEAVAVIGFTIAYFSGSAWEMLRAAGIALVVFIINFPRKSVWK